MKIKQICIVGGGTSGWMIASALLKHCKNLEVTLIESEDIPIIGVGEATVPSTTHFINEYLGFDEKEWMPYCDATYKASIRFKQFKKIDEDDIIYHPFWTEEENLTNGANWLIKNKLEGDSLPKSDYYNSHYIAAHMSDNNKFSKLDNFNYAHHLDAIKFGQFCKEKALQKGLNYIVGTITDVQSNDFNQITKVITKDGIELKADFFVDCSGFSAILIDKFFKEPFVDITDYLLSDKAVVARIPYGDNKEEEITPYTDCTALNSGWAWNTPLWSRIGTGYVYSSKFAEENIAEKDFRKYLVDKYGEDRVSKASFKHINIRAGRHLNGWVENCVSLVLASGFIEPLESTGLALMAAQIQKFISTISNTDGSYSFNTLDRAAYNKNINDSLDEVWHFILFHYVSSLRNDTPYWRHISEKVEVPQEALDRLNDLGLSNTNTSTFRTNQWFPYKSWECITIGFEIFKEYNLTFEGRALDSYSKEHRDLISQAITEDLDKKKQKNLDIINNISSHYNYLKDTLYG